MWKKYFSFFLHSYWNHLALLSFVVLICISPFKCACFGYFHSQLHFVCANVCVCVCRSAHFICVFFSCLIHGMWAHDRLGHRREIRVENMYFTSRFISKCVCFENHFFLHFTSTLILNSFVEDVTILCLYGYFSILYTHVDGLCAHISSVFIFLLLLLWFQIYMANSFFFCASLLSAHRSCIRIVLSLAFHFVAIVAVTARPVFGVYKTATLCALCSFLLLCINSIAEACVHSVQCARILRSHKINRRRSCECKYKREHRVK